MTSPGPSATVPYAVNERYLHARTRRPLTIRYVGTLPTATDGQVWIGVEYDDPACGKHSGTYKDIQVFHTLQSGAGAFIKYTGKSTPLVHGPSLVDALEERYGPLAGASPSTAPESVVLGSSNAAIVVEAPNMDSVMRRISKLERLREIGFDGEWVGQLGGTQEQRALFKERLRGVRVLDLSKNLVQSWEDIGEIVEHLPGLTTLILNHSRIQPLRDGDAERCEHAFGGIQELHLGTGVYTWAQVVQLSVVYPNLQILDLNNNPLLTELRPCTALAKVTDLNLDGCPLGWAQAGVLAQLPSLQSLNLAGTPIKSIPECSGAPFPNLKRLSLTDTLVSRWADIDNLAAWTNGKLENLRISCAGDSERGHEHNHALNPQFMSGNARTDRPFLIAKLSALTMLNGTTISSAERWDAEVYYLHFVNNLSLPNPSIWGRFEELVALHGPAEKEAPRQTTLKSKLLTLHIIPPSGLSFTFRILPSAPVSLLNKKVAKQLKVPKASVWTARQHDSLLAAWEPVEELQDGMDVGMYVTDGDHVVVVV